MNDCKEPNEIVNSDVSDVQEYLNASSIQDEPSTTPRDEELSIAFPHRGEQLMTTSDRKKHSMALHTEEVRSAPVSSTEAKQSTAFTNEEGHLAASSPENEYLNASPFGRDSVSPASSTQRNHNNYSPVVSRTSLRSNI